MPLTNATHFTTAQTRSVIENWLFEIDDSAGGVLRLAYADTTVGGNKYAGAVLNRVSIRSSIDLAKSSAGTGNLSIEVANFVLAGVPLSEKLVFGSTKYLNRECRVYIQLNGQATLANCLRVYTGRLTSVSHRLGTIRMEFEEARPWDFIKIPQDRTTSRNRLFPLVYGNFTANGSIPGSEGFCTSSALWPAQVDQRGSQSIVCLAPRSYSAGAELHIYEETSDSFVAIVDEDDAITQVSFSAVGGNCIAADAKLRHGWLLKSSSAGPGDGDTVTFSNVANIYDYPHTNDTSNTKASDTLNITNIAGDSGTMYVGLPRPQHPLADGSTLYATVYWTATKTGAGTPVSTNITMTTTGATAASSNLNYGLGAQSATMSKVITGGEDPPAYLKITINSGVVGGGGPATSIQVDIYDVVLTYVSEVDDTAEPQAITNATDRVKWLYCGGDGLQDFDLSGSGTNYWINGNSTPSNITEIHQVHRDLVHRFTSYSGTPTGWSDLDTAKSGWDVRWWLHEQVGLKETLEQLQYEGGFVFMWDADGTGKYIFVADSYSSGDVTATLSHGDVAVVDVSHTDFGSLVTKKSIQYDRHPATGDFQSSYSYTNSTARTAYNIQTEENIEQVELEMLVAEVDEHAAYYGNINGDIKAVVKCEVLDPYRFNLTVGDIVQFDAAAMPFRAFAGAWTQYFMITDCVRSMGSLKITCVEVG